MSNPAEPLTNDPIALQAMLAAERVENERLRQIIKELQRHRFGRRAESLPGVQLLLGLEEVEAEGLAAEEAADPAKLEPRIRKRRINRGSLYVSVPHTEHLAGTGDEPLIGSTGDHYDEALPEIITGLYKAELIYQPGVRSFEADEFAIRNGWMASTIACCSSPSGTSSLRKPRYATTPSCETSLGRVTQTNKPPAKADAIQFAG